MKVKKILISQPEPANLEKSPYRNLVQKHKVDITFFKFFKIVGIPAAEFRKTRIHINDYSAVIFNSKNSVDHFFRMLKELRETVSEDMKYFCSTEAIAFYLQNYIQYRKRKVFYGNQYFSDLIELMGKHREEKYLFPCSDEKQTEYTKALDKGKFKYMRAPMYTSEPCDLTRFDLSQYDIIALFSPIGVRSLLKSFPDVGERDLVFAAFGTSTHAALREAGIKLTIAAPTRTAPSMAVAIENYILGKDPGTVIATKGDTVKHSKAPASAVRKVKPVIANKEVYKQRMEEKKAQAAARRAARAAERAKKEAEALRMVMDSTPQEKPVQEKKSVAAKKTGVSTIAVKKTSTVRKSTATEHVEKKATTVKRTVTKKSEGVSSTVEKKKAQEKTSTTAKKSTPKKAVTKKAATGAKTAVGKASTAALKTKTKKKA